MSQGAPEVGQLLAATVPVQHVSTSVGDDLETAGGVLAGYAAEVREIQTRLEALRAQAGEFERSVAGEVDWADDDAQRERSNELVGAVSAAVADFEDAQRRAANAINTLYGGQQYRADDGDGQVESGEYGYSAEQYDQAAASDTGVAWGSTVAEDPGWLSSLGHGFLDVAGLVPVIGEAADGLNAAWYTAEGDYTNAALSAAAMVPFAGWAATAAKGVNKGIDVVRTSRGARREAMSQYGLPRSQQPIAQTQTPAGRQYVYELPAPGGGTRQVAVTEQTTDRVAGHGPHWEVGTVKPPEVYGRDPLGRLRVRNEGKTKVGYGE